jgi:hypothetical protein
VIRLTAGRTPGKFYSIQMTILPVSQKRRGLVPGKFSPILGLGDREHKRRQG